MTFIRWFGEITQGDIELVGGKGANLSELTRAGFPVPPGFIVTTQAYRAFVEANNLQPRILQLASHPQADDPSALPVRLPVPARQIGGTQTGYETTATETRRLFKQGNIPDKVASQILNAYHTLAQYRSDLSEYPPSDNPLRPCRRPQSADHPSVAVRSSATAEDLPEASFAGQQETFLNVRGEAALLDAVKNCWASLWTARAMAYRERQGIEHQGVAMGVVVQAMVPADVSGVLFTANPSTGARDELIVNAGFGLGEAIVAGEVSPDTYVVDRQSLTPKESQLGTKEVMIVADAQGRDGGNTKTQSVPQAKRGQAALSESLLGELAALGIRVEEHFGGVPQDIEWAVADGACWLLQSRPITNLPPAPLRDVRWEPPIPGTVWMRRQVVEHMPEPLSPLFADLYLEEGLEKSVDEMMDFMMDLGDLSDVSRIIKEAIPGSFAVTVNGYAYSVASFDFSWKMVPPVLRIYAFVLPKMVQDLQPYWRKKALPAYLSIIEEWKGVAPSEASDEELLRGMRELAEAEAVYWFAAAIPLGLARVTDALLDRFLKSVTDGESANGAGPQPTSGPYLRGFPTKALEAQTELEAIAEEIQALDELRERVVATPPSRLLDVLAEHPDGQPVLDDLRDYLDVYGHQIYNLDFAVPTLADEPLPVLLSLQAAVEEPEQDARTKQEKLAQERDTLVTRTEEALNPVQQRIFRLLLDWAQRYTPYREEALFYLGAAWPTLRTLALELGRRLTDAGSLNDPDDLFYLNSDELAAASDSRADGLGRPGLARLAQERRELREARKRLDPPISVPPNATLQFGPFRLTAFEPQPSEASEGPTLNGFAVSPGQVTAPASVIRSSQEFDQMVPDTILVCTTTTPAWTPLFSQAKGLVTDIGGALAHGSIVAREYGIPAVMGTGTATQRIRIGQRIQVNGDAGTVTLLDEADAETYEGEDHGEDAQSMETPAGSDTWKKSLLALAAGAIGLTVWWRKRSRKRS